MPTSAILVTYKDMEPGVLPEFIKKATIKYEEYFKRLYFDDAGLKAYLRREVNETPAKGKLKIFISGHGGTGIQCITNDAQNRKQTVEDLTNLLHYALQKRATDPRNSKDTEVNMVSCLFGRTPVGGLGQCPAVRLHLELCRRHVYVDLVARTESVNSKAIGRTTISPRIQSIEEPISGIELNVNRVRKTPFSKIRCTYGNFSPIVEIRTYNHPMFRDEPYINSESREGKRILWADIVVDEIVKYITPSRVAGKMQKITDAKHQKLYDLLIAYEPLRLPEQLKGGMERLMPELSIHRGIHGFGLPKTAELIRNLLRTYPA